MTAWTDGLRALGGHLQNGVVTDFGDAEAELTAVRSGTAGLASVPDLALWQVSGTDAGAFLNAQFCGDLNQVPDVGSMFTAWCNPKGRVIATFIIHRSATIFYLVLCRDIAATMARKLRMYVLRSKVSVDPATADARPLGYIGAMPPPASSAEGLMPATGPGMVIPGGGPRRWLQWVPETTLLQRWTELPATVHRVGSTAWRRLDMQAGLPWIGAATTEQFLPQELNLDRTGGLSFGKGCYPGQEVIARLRYRGEARQRLHGFTLDMTPPPAPGVAIIGAAGEPARLGTVIDAVASGPDRVEGLAVIRTAAVDAGTPLRVASAAAGPLRLHATDPEQAH